LILFGYKIVLAIGCSILRFDTGNGTEQWRDEGNTLSIRGINLTEYCPLRALGDAAAGVTGFHNAHYAYKLSLPSAMILLPKWTGRLH
jgi:hypothetical protein